MKIAESLIFTISRLLLVKLPRLNLRSVIGSRAAYRFVMVCFKEAVVYDDEFPVVQTEHEQFIIVLFIIVNKLKVMLHFIPVKLCCR